MTKRSTPSPFADYPTFEQAAALLPDKPTASSLWRWARLGVKRGNRQVYLRYARCGQRMLVRVADLLLTGGRAQEDVALSGAPVAHEPCTFDGCADCGLARDALPGSR